MTHTNCGTNEQATTLLPWTEEDVYAAVHAVVVDAVISPLNNPGQIDPPIWHLLTTYMTTDEANAQRLLRPYRWGSDLLDDVRLVFSTPFTAYSAQIYEHFSTSADLASPVVVVNCTPQASVPTFAYAALVRRPAPEAPTAVDIPYVAANTDARRATGQHRPTET